MSKPVLDFIASKIGEKNKLISELRARIKANRDLIDEWQKELEGHLAEITELKSDKDKVEK